MRSVKYSHLLFVGTLFVVSILQIAAAANLQEGWENARVGDYEPGETVNAIIHGDAGTWLIDATIDGSDEGESEISCGPVPHQAEIIQEDGNKYLSLLSGTSSQGCSDNIWAVFFADWGTPVNNHISIPITPDTILSFEETGDLDFPVIHGWGGSCGFPPCYDNISVKVEDTAGNVIAYVMQRPSVQPEETINHYREIFLDPDAGVYTRNLYDDFSLIPGFQTGNNIYSISIQIDEHGWCIIDNINITNGQPAEATSGQCNLTGIFGRIGFDESMISGTEITKPVQLLIANQGPEAIENPAAITVQFYARPLWADEDPSYDIFLTEVTNVSIGNLKPGKTKNLNAKVTIPADIEEDDYVLVALIDAGEDIPETDETDNTVISDGYATVAAANVDMVPALINPTIPNSVVAGDQTKIKLPIIIFNNGNVACPNGAAINLTFMARPSADLNDSTQDIILTTLEGVSISNLKPDKLKKLNTIVYLPAGMAQGNYVIGVDVDTADEIAESNETNNMVFTSPLSVAPGYIDFAGAIAATRLPDSLLAGSTAKGTVQVNVTNMGNVAAAKGQKISMSIVAKNTSTQQEWQLLPINKQFLSVSNLKPGMSKKYNGNVIIPDSLPEGAYDIIVTIDSAQEVAESDETNNVLNELSLQILSVADQLLGSWGVTSVQGAPGKVNASNSTWTFYSNGTYSWFLYYPPYYDEIDSGSYSFDGQTLTVTGGIAYQLFVANSAQITLKNNTFSFRDNENDKWTYKRISTP